MWLQRAGRVGSRSLYMTSHPPSRRTRTASRVRSPGLSGGVLNSSRTDHVCTGLSAAGAGLTLTSLTGPLVTIVIERGKRRWNVELTVIGCDGVTPLDVATVIVFGTVFVLASAKEATFR